MNGVHKNYPQHIMQGFCKKVYFNLFTSLKRAYMLYYSWDCGLRSSLMQRWWSEKTSFFVSAFECQSLRAICLLQNDTIKVNCALHFEYGFD